MLHGTLLDSTNTGQLESHTVFIRPDLLLLLFGMVWQTCKACYSLKDTISFWKLLIMSISMLRPVPILPEQPSLADVRRAVIQSYKLHLKWTIRHDATPTRVYTLAPCRNPTSRERLPSPSSWTLAIDDGLHVLQADSDSSVRLRLLTTGEVVWQWFLQTDRIVCLDYALHQGDILLILHLLVNE